MSATILWERVAKTGTALAVETPSKFTATMNEVFGNPMNEVFGNPAWLLTENDVPKLRAMGAMWNIEAPKNTNYYHDLADLVIQFKAIRVWPEY